jgi:hypothetical protein
VLASHRAVVFVGHRVTVLLQVLETFLCRGNVAEIFIWHYYFCRRTLGCGIRGVPQSYGSASTSTQGIIAHCICVVVYVTELGVSRSKEHLLQLESLSIELCLWYLAVTEDIERLTISFANTDITLSIAAYILIRRQWREQNRVRVVVVCHGTCCQQAQAKSPRLAARIRKGRRTCLGGCWLGGELRLETISHRWFHRTLYRIRIPSKSKLEIPRSIRWCYIVELVCLILFLCDYIYLYDCNCEWL